MSNGKHSQRGGDRGLLATVAAVAFLVTGLTLVGVAIASQRTAPVPAASDFSMGVAETIAISQRSLAPTIRAMAPATQTATLARSKPVALDIPAIDVHSTVQHLGQAADGALETPAGAHYDEAAWYRHSPTPGSLGPAILLGHIDSAANGPSVFFRLGELTRGDRVSVTRADGSKAVFEVDSVERYAKDNFPTQVVYGDIDHAGLRILTCGGAFDDSTGHYLDNIVVFATLVH